MKTLSLIFSFLVLVSTSNAGATARPKGSAEYCEDVKMKITAFRAGMVLENGKRLDAIVFMPLREKLARERFQSYREKHTEMRFQWLVYCATDEELSEWTSTGPK